MPLTVPDQIKMDDRRLLVRSDLFQSIANHIESLSPDIGRVRAEDAADWILEKMWESQ